MSSEEGGVVWVSVSSSVRRTRSSRGTLTGAVDELAPFVVAFAARFGFG
jgi:hypothetical protein